MGPDTTLTRRVAATLGALALLNLAFVAAVGYLLAPWVRPLVAALAAALPLGPASAPVAWLVAVGAPLLALFLRAQIGYARRYAVSAVGAREVDRDEYPDLHARIDRLAHLADCPPPRVAVVDSAVPNSLAVGTARDATVVVSEGLLETLDDAELDAVLAHELAHVANRDVTVMTLATFIPAVASGEYAPLADLLGGRRVWPVAAAGAALVALAAATVPDGVAAVSALSAAAAVLIATYLLGGIVLGVVAVPVVLLSRSLSRTREFAADRAAAVVTGDPAAVASAVRTLATDPARPPDADRRSARRGVRALCFVSHGFGGDGAEDPPFDVPVRSHPPAEDRTRRLREVAADQ
ncbi:M48 family metalloprotease [Halomicrobium salinisoli]|uniref:M48 family metalloprotease n=1 Tax=Halomicrobium salinisoli TaxID=2878391 RepID=UPI001CF06C4D|nr:M48 family metalloprotease [Halomicrobium salinisoli]